MSNVKKILMECLNAGDIDRAYELLDSNLHGEISDLKCDAEYCVLAATTYLNKDDMSKAFDLMTLGLLADNHNYELYLILGEYYARSNINQALLCFYQALFYCYEQEDRLVIESYISDALTHGAEIRRISFVVVTRNQSEKLKKCLDSIVSTVIDGMYEIVIVDNASTDNTRKWVTEIEGIKYWRSEDVRDYHQIANQGIRLAEAFNDVFLIDADCVLFDNSFFYMMLGMYSNDKIGVVSCITNGFVDEQKGRIDALSFQEAKQLASTINAPMIDAYEKSVYVTAHAMIICRKAIERVGIFGEDFLGDSYEDKDYCMRVNYAGMNVIFCFNSYIYRGVRENPEFEETLTTNNKDLFYEKWGFNVDYSNAARDEIINLIDAENNKPIEVLELGCAMGSTLNRVERLWPKANVYGIEYDEAVVNVAEKIGNIIQGDVESMEIPYDLKMFDYIICADVLEHLRNPQATLKRFIPYLKDEGKFIISIPNVRHYVVIMLLALEGRFDYSSDGILDATHIRFFTRDTAKEMIEKAGLKVVDIQKNYNGHPEDNDYISKLQQMFNVYEPDDLKVFQFYFVAQKQA